MNILILGANGFIGSNLITHILAKTDWYVTGLDLHNHKLTPHLQHPRLNFKQGDIRQNHDFIEAKISRADMVLPLAAIASPAAYVNDPLSVFELDFECNLAIVRACVAHKKRIIFPSSSEVYGMQTEPCNEDTSNLITGPTHKERWIYASSKQLMDRVIYAYGAHHQLPYTLFRPFNWFGPNLDNAWQDAKSNRVIATFLNSLLHHRDLTLVDGGAQKRCFLYIEDAIDALMRIIENKGGIADNRIFNIGHPGNEASIGELASHMLDIMGEFPGYESIREKVNLITTPGGDYYGAGYQDMDARIPDIAAAKTLGWNPTTSLTDGLRKTIAYTLSQKI